MNNCIDSLSEKISKELEKYSNVKVEEMKTAVLNASDTVKKEIKRNAPRKTGKYAGSFVCKKVLDTPTALKIVVYSKNKYQLTHLLEYGHAKRNGGRVLGKAHIALAEKLGIKELEEQLKRSLSK